MNLQRLLVERIEHRIIVGTVAFLGIMVLVGWIAINENGRMQAFQRQYEARAIERGAELFTANCSTCHGNNGYGGGRGPALNSPYLFGFDFLAQTRRERIGLETELSLGVSDERAAAIQARLTEIEAIEAPIRQQMQPAIDKGYNPDAPSRLANIGWGGSLHSFIYTTLVHGRPLSGFYWPNQMAAWGQTAGGPLRSDQLEDLTAYILNWDKGSEWTIDDLLRVEMFPKVPVDGAIVAELLANAEPRVGVNTPTDQIMVGLADVTGDPQNGQVLYNGALACSGCHMNAAVAPLTEGTWTRVNEVRLQEAQFAGYTGEMYLAESIIHPNDYISPGYGAGLMPANYGERLTYQDLADLIAYLASQDQPIN